MISIQICDSAGVFLEGAGWSYGNQYGISGSRGEITFRDEGRGILEVRMLGFETLRWMIEPGASANQKLIMRSVPFTGSEAVISATRAENRTPAAFSNIKSSDLRKVNLGQDLPILLQDVPSVLFTSDAGAGVGYTGISVRGSDATRVNITLNGIPMNDAESHGLFWVNLPDLASSLTDIQIQRGVGTSTNGAAAFGASINMQSHRTIEKAFSELNVSGGSFGTIRTNLKFGTGVLPGNFSFEGRVSKINSQGFIDRAFSDLSSGMGTLSWYGKMTQVHADVLIGRETTYQSWNGIPESRLTGDRQGMEQYIQRNGLDEEDASLLLNSGSRTYNPFSYENQTDNYQQDHYQLHLTHQFSRRLQWNQSLHYTRGRGYYEEYRKNDTYSLYGIFPKDTLGSIVAYGNLTRKRWLDNHFFGTVYSLIYHDSSRTKWIYGGAVNRYYGEHFGESLWNSYQVSAGNPYYYNDARKDEANQFFRIEHELIKGLMLYGDIQYRIIQYRFDGFDQQLRPSRQNANYGFFNPKAGLSYFCRAGTFYYSAATGQREPVRDDFINSSPESRPKPESLLDHELGWRKNTGIWSAGINLYAMEYRNQLVLTGQINDVGAYTRVNAGKSYRRGIEAEFRYRIIPSIIISGNAMLSSNRIQRFENYTDNYDTGLQEEEILYDTPIALSPGFIGFTSIAWQPSAGAELHLSTKSAGRQFLDNTGNISRSIEPWNIFYLRGTYRWHFRNLKDLSVFFMVNNLFNQQWESHGYSFGYISGGGRIQENFYFPQAGRNFLTGISVRI
jgi:iron complex outermembrane receptor protein